MNTMRPSLLPAKILAFLLVAGSVAPRLSAAQAGQSGTREEAVDIATPGGSVYGSLLLPPGAGPHPVALIIAGSGPTDRNGNSPLLPGQNNSLRLLAEGLAERGIASVRYDKRGIAASAASAPREIDLRFDTYVDDAVAWIRKLQADPRFSSVSVVGHSEGSLIGMRAAGLTNATAFVSIAGIARRAPDVLRDQLHLRCARRLTSNVV
jgi:pimeloyl-ACP methyl ester carboxylesterase